MATSVGQIGLDLVVNKNDFNRQMSGIQSMAKKAGAVLAGAFAIKKLVDFGAQSVKLAQVQQEAETKLATVMQQRMKATDAAVQSIMEFTSAQQALGVVGDETQMAGAQQLSTFLKTSGALETLIPAMNNLAVQQNGVNVSAGNMVEIGNLMGKVMQGQTSALTRVGITFDAAEEKALKYGTEEERAAVLAQVITNNVGEMNKAIAATPAGQIQQLKNNFGDLMEVIGSGIQAALMPAIRVLNILVGKLLSAANAVKAFFSMFSGGKGAQTKAITAGTDAVTKSANAASGALGGAGSAAKKAAKDIKNATSGIDELNVISPNEDTDSGGGGGGGEAADGFDAGAINAVPESLEKADGFMQKLVNRLKELKDLFVAGFWDGLGDTSVFDSIKGEIKSIRGSLREIFTDPEVVRSANHFADTVAYSLGQIAGSIASIGLTIADNLLGGIALYLGQNTQRIKDYIVNMFDIGSEIFAITGEFYKAFANIFTAFRSAPAKQLTADIIGIFADGFMGITELALKLHRDIKIILSKPIIDNQSGLKTALEGILESFEIVAAGIKTVVDAIVDTLNATYDAHFKPLFDTIAQGLSDILEKFLTFWNKDVKPVMDAIAKRLSDMLTGTLIPLVNRVGDLLGSIADACSALWTGAIQPFIEWVIANVLPVLLPIVQTIANTVIDAVGAMITVIDGVVQILQGVIDFIVGVFTGDWDLAWKGINEICAGAMQAIQAIINTALQAINSIWTAIWTAIKIFALKIWNGIQTGIETVITDIHDGIEEALDKIKEVWTEIWTGLKETTIEIFEGIWDGIKGAINNILGGVETMANGVIKGINRMIEALNKLSFDIPDWVPDVGGNSFGLHIPTIPTIDLPRLASGGFVRANTPQLAMIGDNRHQGEIVAPEDKLQAMVDKAVSLASRSDIAEQYLISVLGLLQKIVELIEAMDLTVEIDIREIRQKIADLDQRSGYKLRTT